MADIEDFLEDMWQKIRDGEIFPSQSLLYMEEVRERSLRVLIEQHDLSSIRLAKTILILGILASNWKRYKLAIGYLERSIKVYSNLLNISNECKALDVENNPVDENQVKHELSLAHSYLGENFKEMGYLKEACDHFGKSVELSEESKGLCCYNLSILAFKCMNLEKAIDFGLKSHQLFMELPASWNENKITLGKSERLLSLIYLAKGDHLKSKKWMDVLQVTLQTVPLPSRVWLDILFMEMEIVLWRGYTQVGTETKYKLDWILTLDLDLSERLEMLEWKLLLHFHQKDMQKMNECIAALRDLIDEDVITEDIAKAIYGLSKILYMNKDYSGALALVQGCLSDLDQFALDTEFDMKGRLNLLKGEILISSNGSELDIMNTFTYAEKFLKECYLETHYIMALLKQSTARAHLEFGRQLMAQQLLMEARGVMASFSPHSLAFMKLNFDFVEVHIRRKKYRSAIELLEEMVGTMETCRVMPHEPFCHDSKWQCAELSATPHDTLLKEAKETLEQLKKSHPHLVGSDDDESD